MHRVQMRGHAGDGALLAFTNEHIIELVGENFTAALNTALPDVLLQERDHLLFPAGIGRHRQQLFEQFQFHDGKISLVIYKVKDKSVDGRPRPIIMIV